jgi:hypothetical protein
MNACIGCDAEHCVFDAIAAAMGQAARKIQKLKFISPSLRRYEVQCRDRAKRNIGNRRLVD